MSLGVVDSVIIADKALKTVLLMLAENNYDRKRNTTKDGDDRKRIYKKAKDERRVRSRRILER